MQFLETFLIQNIFLKFFSLSPLFKFPAPYTLQVFLGNINNRVVESHSSQYCIYHIFPADTFHILYPCSFINIILIFQVILILLLLLTFLSFSSLLFWVIIFCMIYLVHHCSIHHFWGNVTNHDSSHCLQYLVNTTNVWHQVHNAIYLSAKDILICVDSELTRYYWPCSFCNSHILYVVFLSLQREKGEVLSIREWKEFIL